MQIYSSNYDKKLADTCRNFICINYINNQKWVDLK